MYMDVLVVGGFVITYKHLASVPITPDVHNCRGNLIFIKETISFAVGDTIVFLYRFNGF